MLLYLLSGVSWAGDYFLLESLKESSFKDRSSNKYGNFGYIKNKAQKETAKYIFFDMDPHIWAYWFQKTPLIHIWSSMDTFPAGKKKQLLGKTQRTAVKSTLTEEDSSNSFAKEFPFLTGGGSASDGKDVSYTEYFHRTGRDLPEKRRHQEDSFEEQEAESFITIDDFASQNLMRPEIQGRKSRVFTPERKAFQSIRDRLAVEEEKPSPIDDRESRTLSIEDDEGPVRIEIKADEVRYSKGILTAEGNAFVSYRGIDLEAHKLIYDSYAKEIEASGDVAITKDGDRITGSSLRFNMLTQKAGIEDAYGFAENISVGDVDLQNKIFFWGESVQWEQDYIFVKKGTITSCDLPLNEVHYHISGDEIMIYPREKLIVRKARLFYKQNQLLGLHNAVFSLRQRDPRMRQSYIPQVGRNQQEGLYVKEAVGYLWGKEDYGALHLDWYEKTGIGAGLEHYYHLGERGAGKLYYYNMGSSTSKTGRYNFSNRMYYRFPGNYFMSLNYTSERYEFPEYSSPDIRSADFYLSHFNHSSMYALRVKDYVSGENRNYGFNFLNQYKFSDMFRSQMVIDYLSSEVFNKRQYRLNTLGRLLYQGDVFDSALTYDKTTGDRQFYVNREPELSFRSKPFSAGPFDGRLSIAAGSFHEMPSNISALRSDIKLSILDKVYPITETTGFSFAGGARQLLYGSGERKYVLRSQANLQQNIGRDVTFLTTHFYQDRNGFSPLAVDYFERYNILGGSLEYFNQKDFRLMVTGGYDLNNKQYQTLIPTVEYSPSKDWYFLFSSNYNIDSKNWRSLDGEVGLKLNENLSVRYWGLYDFINRKMTYQNYMVELDSHDFASRIIYKGSQGELWLSMALKLFPYEKVEVGPDSNRSIIRRQLLERAPEDDSL